MVASYPSDPPRPRRTARELAGALIVRALVPAWIAFGVVFELVEASPATLPKTLRLLAHHVGIEPFAWLAILVSLEIFAVAVMVCVRSLARPMALFMLVSFCFILVGEMLAGNFTSCGCFGALSVPPWITLLGDLVLFAAVLALPPRVGARSPMRPGAVVAAAAVTVAGALLVALRVLPAGAPAVSAAEPAVAGTDPTSAALPTYYRPEVSAWVDRRFDELDIARWVPQLPPSVATGRSYVVLYSRTCDHCDELMRAYFAGVPDHPPTLAVAMPETPAGFKATGARPLACESCLTAELPVGPDWIITPPLLVALDDGVVVCATEGESVEAPRCLLWDESL